MGALKHYHHLPMRLAQQECRAGERQRYRVTTINWTYATVRGKKDYGLVHRNVYSFTLRGLVRFIREIGDVAEDIIAIEPEAKKGA
jgi:hypothetical protein